MAETHFQRLGAARLRRIVEDFGQRMVHDPMIGFMFWDVDVPTLVQREFEFTSRLLGEKVEYTGRPIGRVHLRFQIRGGQFDRRRQLLAQTLEDHQVPADIRRDWLRHVDAFRHRLVSQVPTEPESVEAEEPRRRRMPRLRLVE